MDRFTSAKKASLSVAGRGVKRIAWSLPHLLSLFFWSAFASSALAAPTNANLRSRPYGDNTGVGIAVGTGLSGISLYHDLSRDAFVQGVVAIGSFGGLGLVGDYAVVIPDVIKDTRFLRAYYGGGLILLKYPRSWYYPYRDRYEDAVFIGAHMPIGLQLMIPNTPLQLAFQLEPGIWVAPGTFVFLDALITFRFLF